MEVGDSNYFVIGCSMPKKHEFVKVQPLGFRGTQDFQPLFVLSVKYFTIDHVSEICTLSYTSYKENEKNRIDRIMFLVYIYSGGKL